MYNTTMSKKEIEKNLNFGDCNNIFSFVIEALKDVLTKE
jgi:hypothetical protein